MQKLWKIGYGLFVVAVIALAALLVGSMAPIPGNYRTKVVLSGSMAPAISVGSLVIIRPAPPYKIGDVITFGKDGKKDVPTTHRIVEMRAEAGVMVYVTKGDANEDKDVSEVRENEVIGKVLFTIPYLGYVIDFARKPVGMVLLIIIPAVVVIGDEVRKIVVEIKRIRQKKMAERDSSSGTT